MANALGRISGQLLKDNLTRNDRDLAFDTDLLFLNVNSRYIGVNSDVPYRPLLVSGKTLTTNLLSNTLAMPTISVGTNEIASDSILNLVASNYVNANKITTDDISIDGNILSTTSTNQSLLIQPNGLGTVEIVNDLNVTGNLYTTNDITLDGHIIFGSDDQDTVTFSADINSDIVPDQNNFYSLGGNPSTGGARWEGVYSNLINGQEITLLGIISGDVDQVLRQGNIWYVAANGDDTNVGDHQEGPFATIAKALSESVAGDTVYIYPGTYEEIFPLTVPVGVTVKGSGIRSVTVVPTVGTNTNNAFLLNGETTVSDLTIKNFYTSYAFSFASNFLVTTRSPYLQNITVITSESSLGANDAGKGALVDGSVAHADTKEASMLFHSVTFITPGADAVTMTNGVRVEWLNSFTYFANRGLYATQGTLGLSSLGLRFGGEIRSIGSACVYGTYGAVADGADTLMYLINHNFAYIGAGTNSTNDPTLNIQSNEAVELNDGKIYYQSVDNKGNFTVGDAFNVSFETGRATINGITTSATGVSSINFSSVDSETIVNSQLVSTGNLKFEGNDINSLIGSVDLISNTNEILLNSNTDITQSLEITSNFNIGGTLTVGNQFIDVVTFNAPVEFDFRPELPTYILGSSDNKWSRVYLSAAQIDDTISISTNTISTIVTDTDLELTANGTGKVSTVSTDVEIDQTLDVSGTSTLQNLSASGSILINGLYDQTGNYVQTGDRSVSGLLTVTSDVFFDDINFVNNRILTTIGNNDLELAANGAGIVRFNENLRIVNDFTVGTLETNGLTNSGTIASDIFTNDDIIIDSNSIRTTVSNNNLVLSANGTGLINIPNNSLLIDTNLEVLDTSMFKNTVINGLLDFTGNKIQVGNITDHTGDFDLTGNLTVTGTNAYFKDIRIVNNQIYTNLTNSDLILSANGTGIINLNDYTSIGLDITVSGLLSTNILSSTGTIASNLFSNTDIEIYDNIITTTIGNNNLILQANGTGNPTLEKIKFDSNTIRSTTTNSNITLTVPTGNLIFDASTALKVPVGTTADRPTLTQGEFRFNSTLSLYRGFNTTAITFGGVYSENRLTNVVAHPTNNTLLFTTNSTNAMTLSSSGIALSALSVDSSQLFLSSNTITTTASSDLTLAPNGTGSVVIDSWAFGASSITNLNLTDPLIFQNTGGGYVSFSGTSGLVIPSGDTASQPANPVIGDLRYNTETESGEVFDGVSYVSIAGDQGNQISGAESADISALMNLIFG